ncbi:hypothetical protein [uncultured Sphingomonas sp.]|uniref:hypothetical protein n=1 Tax=uncultured Sphingomonas sp. TaxID=158754 RepID=UPI0025FB3DF1|nr:hypothetical protein [uncultured Sphingomonas sp.]
MTFDDLVEIYRHTQFGADGEGALTIASQAILDHLGAIDADPRLYDDVQIGLLDDAPPVLGAKVRIAVGHPRHSLGLLVRDFDALFQAPRAAFEEPSRYYVVDPGYASGDLPAPATLARYRALLDVVAILRDAASYVDEVQRELVFIGAEKTVVPIAFRAADLGTDLEENVARLKRVFHDPLHGDEKREILATAVVQLVGGLRQSVRFPHLVRNLDAVCDEVDKGYRLFVSSFSYSKIRDDVETARIEFVGKIHKTIVDIQGQLLGIPVATIVVASQMKSATGCGLPFWTNTAVLLGAWIFVALLAIAIVNQWHTLTVLDTEIRRQQQRITDDYALVSGEFADQFEDLIGRIWWHRAALGAVGGVAGLSALLATVAYLMLTARGSGACIALWN